MELAINELKSIDEKILVKPYSPNLGGVFTGLDISKLISISDLKFIKQAFHKYQVLFFQKQSEISPEIQVSFGKSFSALHVHPAAPTIK